MPNEVTLIYRPTEAGTYPLRWFVSWLEREAHKLDALAEVKDVEMTGRWVDRDGAIQEPGLKIVCRVPESADHKNNRARQQYGELPA